MSRSRETIRGRAGRPICAWLNCTNSRPVGRDFCDVHTDQPCPFCEYPIEDVANYVETLAGDAAHLSCFINHRAAKASASPSGSRAPRPGSTPRHAP